MFWINALLWVAALLAPPQDLQAHAELFVRPAPDASAGEVRAAIRVRIEHGWHLYHDVLGQPDAVGKRTTVELGGVEGEWSDVRFPEPLRLEQPGLGKDGRDTWIWGHKGTIVLYAAGHLAAGAAPGGVEATLSGLTCVDDGSCVPYDEDVSSSGAGPDALFADFPADLVSPAAAGAAKSTAPAASGAGAKTKAPATKGFDTQGGFGGASFGGGAEEHASAELFVRRADGVVRGAIRVRIAPGWHLYHDDLGPPDATGTATKVALSGGGVTWGRVVFPEPLRLEQPGLGKGGADTWIWGHEGTIVLQATGEADASADLGAVEAKIVGLTCEDNGSCVPYHETVASSGAGPDELFAGPPVPGPGEGGAQEQPPASEVRGAGAEAGSTRTAEQWDAVTFPHYEPRGKPTDRSLLVWLLFAFIAGAILNVMPCVLPVVSIKILSFVQQAGESRKRIFQLGLAFSAGILTIFLVLAALAAFAGKEWGEQFQSQRFLIVMIAIVFGFSLSLFDVYEIGVPQQVGQLAAQRREGLVDAFFKGMMATVLATPCSGPFLGSTLAWALTQSQAKIFLIFTFVGLGMAVPYTLLTANPGFLRFVPKPGQWMQTFKHLMGFLLLGTVVFLMISLRQDLHVYTVAFLVFVALACWVWGHFATFDQTPARRMLTVMWVVAVLVLGAWVSFTGLRSLFVGSGEGKGHLEWVDFDPAALQRYHEEGTSVFLDFTANWCLTCKANEKFTYESEEIVALLASKHVVAMRADETDDTPKTRAIQRLREELGARSIPFMAVFPGDDWEHPYTLKDVVTKGQMRQILEQLP